ncbi:PRC-barrel domain-containing protein [Desulfitobacterium metallireducens]|uniref:Photosystem reaction center subunit H n=1 Tax=Desulfitobacterium metallireducens DSM 15288 TaxID=871968 RepID=W0E4Q6_9FIRM|nr:PRC-barrel domain-containing protein [Desulfitobacterium metallireducens]AHF05717.1 photosystem reaction center subunit H [Desulfitobacterium metallireducens DSM 15288]
MKPSRKFLSLPIVSLSEGQHIGYVKSLVIDARTKSLAALVVDLKGFFKDQRIIPYGKVISVGDDAITIDKGAHVEKSANLPEILSLIKEKLSIIGTRVITQSGKTLGVAEEYFIESETGRITQIQISGGKLEGLLNGKAILQAEYISTIGQDVIVTEKGSETHLVTADKGLSDSFKSLVHSTSHLASETTHSFGKYFKKKEPLDFAQEPREGESLPLDQDGVIVTESTLEPSETTEIASSPSASASEEDSSSSAPNPITKENLV